MQRSTAWLAGLLLVTLLAACGGGGNAAPQDGGAGGGGATNAPATSDEPAATAASGGSTQPAEPAAGAGGGPAGGVCDLATTDELATVFGVAVTATVLAGPPDTCMIEDPDGSVLVSWVYSSENAQGVYEMFTVDSAYATAVSGLGDRAAFVENTGLMILKGNGLTTVAISGQSGLDEDEATDAAKKVGEFIAGRM